MLGTTVGTYRITGVVGRGGIGTVYAAEHTLLGRPVAVKVLLPEYSQNQDLVTRLFNEARAAASIRYPGIVEIYDFGWSADGVAYIAMEMLKGENLACRLARGRLPLTQALPIIRQIASALAAAHRTKIVHRDLKPDNVFLVRDPSGDRVKLLDFGIAKLHGEFSRTMTRTGTLIGTPTYMAPEQCRGVAVDHRADLYALGCMLFELLSGRPPFIGEGGGEILAAHIHVPPPSLVSLVPDAPPAICQLVDRLLRKDQAQRVQTADEAIRLIDSALGGGSASGVIATATTLSGATGETGNRTRTISVKVTIGTLLVTGATIAIVVGASGDDVPSTPSAAISEQDVASTVEGASPPSAAVSVESAGPPLSTVPLRDAGAAMPTTTLDAAVATITLDAAVEPAATVAIKLATAPRGAQVIVNGTSLGKTPCTITLPRSIERTTITFRIASFRDTTIAIVPDADVVKAVKLKPAPKPQPTDDQSVNPF